MSDKTNVNWWPPRNGRVAVFLCLMILGSLLILPQPVQAWMQYANADSTSGLRSNTVIDIEWDGQYWWLGTGSGLSRARIVNLDSVEFVTWDSEVLNADEVSALAIGNGEIWVGPSFSEVRSKQLVPFGAGFNYSLDGGATWLSTVPDQADGGGRICYDLAMMDADKSIWAACFYGGLIRSLDGGMTWENVFPSPSAELDYESETFRDLNNRFFSVITDESGLDSLQVWAGSAAGIKRFIFLDESLKLTGSYVTDIARDDDDIWVATETGLSVSGDGGGSWRTFDQLRGFPTDPVASVEVLPSGVWAGSGSFFDTVGAGIAFSVDGGETWTISEPAHAVGAGNLAVDFAEYDNVVYAACLDGGLIYSTDSGATWTEFTSPDLTAATYFALLDPFSYLDTVASMFVATDSNLFELAFSDGPEPDFIIHREVSIGEAGNPTRLSSHIIEVALQDIDDGDRQLLWTLQHAADGNEDGFAYSEDYGETWTRFPGSFKPFAIDFADSVYYIGFEAGLLRDTIRIIPTESEFLTGLDDVLGGDDDTTDVRSLMVTDDRLWVGSDLGMAFSVDLGVTWEKITVNPDPTVPDDTLSYFSNSADSTTISGNFVTAMAVQPHPAGERIWAATQQTASNQENGISVTRTDGESWERRVVGVRVWNFAFSGAYAYAAASEGLLKSENYGATWDTITTFVDAVSGVTIPELTEVFGVEAVGDTVWVGTDNGMAVSFDRAESWQTVFEFQEDETEPYVTPTPFSPSERITPGVMYFHFLPPASGAVTITVFDFANRKVVELTGDHSVTAGEWSHQDFFWDATHEDGENVALGTYFFVIEYNDGSVQDGKLVVIP